MPSKLQAYRLMAEEASRQLTGSYQGWTDFLTTAARLYKYPYNEQVMIHAQRPDATACAEYDVWNKTMRRYVRRGSKGIALVDTRGDEPKLRYVFDVSDTGSLENSRAVRLWQLRPEHTDSISAMLERTYDVPGANGLQEQLEAVAAQLADEYWNEHQRDFFDILEDSFLEEYDDFNVGVQFRTAATVSITYALMSRCGLEPEDYFEHEDFLSIFDFNTPATVAALGTAISQINQQVLRQIETTIRNYEREQSRPAMAAERTETNDRADLHPERGLSDSRPDPNRAAQEASGQVREDAQEVFAGASPDPVEPDDSIGDPVPAPVGDRRNGEPQAGTDDEGNGGTERRDRAPESNRPHEVGRSDEQPESAGRGDSAERADLQLTPEPQESPFGAPVGSVVQLSLFPTENEQIAYIHQAERDQPAHSAFSMSIPQEDIDHILRCGGNVDDARMEITTEFSKGKSIEELAAYLHQLYHGGNGIITDSGRYSAWYAEDGIHIANGDSARYLSSARVVTWKEAAERIGILLDSGEFATNVELEEAPGHERMEIAKKLWNLRHDFSESAIEQGYLPSIENFRGNNFPDETAALAEALKEPATRESLVSEYIWFNEAYRKDTSLMRFHYHKNVELLAQLSELSLPRREYASDMAAVPEIGSFITEDEIAAALTRGSNVEGSKGRIYAYFTEKHTPKEQADFLKKEYGIGGSSHAVSDANRSWRDHNSKGFVLKKGDCPEVQLNWNNVAKRMAELVRKERFFTPEEKEKYEAFRAREAARATGYESYNAIKEAHPDEIVLYQVGDFFEMYGEDAKQAAELLDLSLTSRRIEEIGRIEMCGIPAHRLEQYVEKLRDTHDVTVAAKDDNGADYRTYTLRSIDHEAEQAINEHEAEYGADGTRAFSAPEPEVTKPTVGELFERYKPMIAAAASENMAYRNACGHSDRESAVIEGNAAIRRAILESGDMELIRLYSDIPDFRRRLHQEVIEETYPRLHELLRPLSQDDIDEALRSWNGDMNSKRAVVRYMADHARDRGTAAWLSREYGGDVDKNLFIVRAGSLEAMELPWAKVQKRIAQLIQKDDFFTDEEKDHFENIDPVVIREHLAENGIVNGEVVDSDKLAQNPFIQQVTADAEQLGAISIHPRDPMAAAYGVGDLVYLDNKEFHITDLSSGQVQLLDPTLRYPIYRVENRKRFEQLLKQDPRNRSYTDFLSANLEDVDADLKEVLISESGLLSQEEAQILVSRFDSGEGNTQIADLLSEMVSDRAETMELETGEMTDYFSSVHGLEINVLDDEMNGKVAMNFSWEEVASVLRSMYQQELFGFTHEAAESAQPTYTTEPVTVYPGDKNNLPYDVVIETLHIDEPEHTPPAQVGNPVSIPVDGEWQEFPNAQAAEQAAYEEYKSNIRRNAQNFHINDEHLGEGGPKAKFQTNIYAIKLLKELEASGSQALPEQQEVLARYVGWGGLADAFDPEKENWRKEYAELKELLTPEEYAAARSSTLNAHYTSPTVIQAIYDAVENMGFRTGNILEPSMGVGNFFGMLPDSMADSKLYGVELDSITGRIAKQLYPKADITVAGFESTDRRDFYDLAVGNVPFGQYQVNDRAYNKLGFSIHDYFFAKSLDQVRPGGVIAFVTSRYTMDKQSAEVRRYIAQRAELLGAIRLPNNAFKANAGTEVVSDIIFLQKRDQPITIEPEWVRLGQNEDGFAINSYFTDHPEMILGRQTSESTQYGKQDFTVEPIEGLELADQLHDAIKYIRGTYREAELPDLGEDETIDTSIPADPNVKNYSYTVVNGEVYFRENSRMVRPELNATAKERVKGMVELRDCVQKLIAQQVDGFTSDDAIRQTQAELNTLYDSFTAKYGLLNSRGNALAFADDSSYYLLCSLEVLDEENNLARKADMFTKRTIKPHEAVTSVDTASEALALSISEKAKVDMAYMSQLTGKDAGALVSDLAGVIFFDPVEQEWQTADEYLSGDVREKLRIAQSYAAPGFPKEGLADYSMNVAALEQAQPKDLDASEIEVRLGATWIDKEYIKQFMFELLEPPFYQRRAIDVHYSEFTAEWSITGKNAVGYGNINAYMTYGTERANAYKILEDTLNLRDVRIYDTKTDADGTERRVLNSKETTLAQQKQQAIKEAFQDWIWKDPDRRRALVQRYNELFNSTRPREYDGSHITFTGMNPEIHLREHQLNAVAHILYGGNTLLAHEVGAGKTFEMVAAAMESKRLGLCQKPLFVVPNHLTEQWASEFLRLYPSANILVATKKDFETRNRKKFCGRIATGDYDAVIIGHSQFERIPVSQERQERLLQEQIWEVEEGLEELKASRAERFTIKSLERTKKGLETKLKKLQDSSRKDDVITFEQLGVDRLYVDEAHSFKNLFLYTKMRNVAGLSTTDAQKSSDMLLKCRYLDEITGSRGVVFATGTPVSNSMTELYTMMRYLQHDTIQKKRLAHFDCWASTFGETTTAIELAPEGTGYRARTRFSKFFNLPELMTLFKEAADIKTADQLHLPTPTPIYHNEVAQPTEIQRGMVQELSERAAKVHAGLVDASEDNMLKITSDGRKLGLDQRVINPDLPDDPTSKVNMCVDNIYRIWDEGQPDKLTQLVFCDLSTPKTTAAPRAAKAVAGSLDSPELHALEALADKTVEDVPTFTIYDDIREKLAARGIPREQIAFIHEANTEARKKELFAKVRSGQVRVLMGSTFKMGAGMNVQDRLVALHDLDCPWRPGDLEQRSGRIIRQGNRNAEVHIYRYVTESTFDAYLWQTVENKQKFISQIMTSKSPVRSCEDIDETALSYAEIKALCAGDERIKEKMDLDVDVARLKLMKANHQSQRYRLEDNLLRTFPAKIEEQKGFIAGLEADMQTLAQHPHPTDGFAGMVVKADQLTDKDNAGAALLEAFKDVKGMEPVSIGTYRGLQMSLTLEDFGREYVLTLKGQMSHRVSLGKDARGNLTRIDNVLSAIPERIQNIQNSLDSIYAQMETAKAEVDKPFPQEEELRQKSARLAELNAELNIDDKTPMERLAEDAPITAKAARPSVLAKLKSTAPSLPVAEKPKHREQETR